ncbi:hypothetical protein [Lysobacter fragariae]
MTNKALPVLALAVALTLPFSASAVNLFGSKTADPEKLIRATADALGYDEEEIKVSDLEKDGSATRYKATLADGTQYRCYVADPGSGALGKIMSLGQDVMSSAQCTKRRSTDKSSKHPDKSSNALLEAAGKH